MVVVKVGVLNNVPDPIELVALGVAYQLNVPVPVAVRATELEAHIMVDVDTGAFGGPVQTLILSKST